MYINYETRSQYYNVNYDVNMTLIVLGKMFFFPFFFLRLGLAIYFVIISDSSHQCHRMKSFIKTPFCLHSFRRIEKCNRKIVLNKIIDIRNILITKLLLFEANESD